MPNASIEYSKEHKAYLEAWKRVMAQGLMTGRPFSPHTVSYYHSYARKFIDKYELVTVQNLKSELLSIPVEQFRKKDKFFKSIICFAKYLIDEKALSETFLAETKKLSPKRHTPPKRITVSEVDLAKVIQCCDSLQLKTLVIVLASTGLWSFECAAVMLDDISLTEGSLLVRSGKGGKRRVVGLNRVAIEVIREFLSVRTSINTSTKTFPKPI